MTRLFLSLIAACFLSGIAIADETKGVVVTIKPLHSLVQGVIGETGEATLLITGAASLHGFSLKPSQMKALQDAKSVFYIDEAMETFLKNALDSLPENVRKIPLSHAAGIELLERREGGAWESQEHDHSRKTNHDAHDGHRMEEHNLHLWLDPVNAEKITLAVAAELSQLYPENKLNYDENAKGIIARLNALDKELNTRLATVQDSPFVVLHDAYPYFEARYKLNAVGSLTLEPDAPVSAKKLKDIRNKLQETGAHCLFREPQFSDRLLRTAAEGLSVKIGVLDPLGADLEPGAELYFKLMNTLVDNLANCLAD